MQLESKKLLEDVRTAVVTIQEFVAGRSFDDYKAHQMLRSAVERQFEIMGEALNRLRRLDQPTAERVAGHEQVIAFRNVLAHGYDVIDDTIVWDIVHAKLGPMHAQVVTLLAEPTKDSTS